MKNVKHIANFIKENQGRSGVYKLVCTINGMGYVGSSSNIGSRASSHLVALKEKERTNSKLQDDFDKYGQECFEFSILCECESSELLLNENKLISELPNLYNHTPRYIDIELTESEQLRFWNRVKLATINDCWVWLGPTDNDGCGRVIFKRKGGYVKSYRSNRLAYFLSNPNDNIDMWVASKCNNSTCCNPKHLFLTIPSKSARRRVDNGKQFQQKLDLEIVKKIREKFVENPFINRHDLAKWVYETFDIDIDPGHLILIGLNKRFPDDNYTPPVRKITTDIADEIRLIYSKNQDMSVKDIVKYLQEHYDMKVVLETVRRILTNERFFDEEYIPIVKKSIYAAKANMEIVSFVYTLDKTHFSYVKMANLVYDKFNVRLTPETISKIHRGLSYKIK